MPPIRSENSKKLAEQEGRILLAIKDLQNDPKLSVRRAADICNVPESTLRSRRTGITNRANSRANCQKLTEFEEQTLRKWILSLDDRGAAPRHAAVRETANILLRARDKIPTQAVGINWVYNYVKRHPELTNRFSKRYNYERAKCEDPKIIGEWFNLVQKTIFENGIHPDDIFNFDETGFAMGLTATARVITRCEYYGRRAVLQPGNREWVTTIECSNASGWVLPPCIIFKAKNIIQSWSDHLPDDWRFETSPNGWTSDE